jgi:hypothetical protein
MTAAGMACRLHEVNNHVRRSPPSVVAGDRPRHLAGDRASIGHFANRDLEPV